MRNIHGTQAGQQVGAERRARRPEHRKQRQMMRSFDDCYRDLSSYSARPQEGLEETKK